MSKLWLHTDIDEMKERTICVLEICAHWKALSGRKKKQWFACAETSSLAASRPKVPMTKVAVHFQDYE
jgi:hypothetical protein